MSNLIVFDNAIQRAAYCAALTTINQPHIVFWCQHQHLDHEPFSKLLSKVQSYLRGELKSLSNLERFHEVFAEWRETLPADDSLGYEIAELCCASLYSAAETLLDDECDDIELIDGNIAAIYASMEGLTTDVDELQRYGRDIQQGLRDVLHDVSQRPVAKDYFLFVKECDISLFGL